MRLEVRGTYPPGWEGISKRVRDAAGGRCIRCFHPAGDTPEALAPCDERCLHVKDSKRRVLTVHHLDGDKANCDWWNLLALCQACHLIIQGRVIPTRPWLLPHSRWFVPYVAGFYALYYGKLHITRAQAEQAPERYLRMGQPWLYERT